MNETINVSIIVSFIFFRIVRRDAGEDDSFLTDSSGTDSVDFDDLELIVQKPTRTYYAKMMTTPSGEVFPIKSEFTAPSLDINVEAIKTEPIDGRDSLNMLNKIYFLPTLYNN